jgi:hypothetical protein
MVKAAFRKPVKRCPPGAEGWAVVKDDGYNSFKSNRQGKFEK